MDLLGPGADGGWGGAPEAPLSNTENIKSCSNETLRVYVTLKLYQTDTTTNDRKFTSNLLNFTVVKNQSYIIVCQTKCPFPYIYAKCITR